MNHVFIALKIIFSICAEVVPCLRPTIRGRGGCDNGSFQGQQPPLRF